MARSRLPATLLLLAAVLPRFASAEPYVWTEQTSLGARIWYSMAASTDGMKVAGAVSGGAVHTSTDGGAHWTAQAGAGNRNWQAIASSSDGVRLLAADYGGSLWTSTDSGANWAEIAGSGPVNWRAVASSSDGTTLVAGVNGELLYVSTDSGATWVDCPGPGSSFWYAVTSSSDGSRLAAAAWNGQIWTSSDSGANWVSRVGAGTRCWRTLACSSNGMVLLGGVGNGGYLYTSTDGGATWTERTGPGLKDWGAVTMSADGTKMFAAVFNGPIYVSTDTGATWTEQTGPGSRSWWAITCSADGSRVVAAICNGSVFTGVPASVPTVTTSPVIRIDGIYASVECGGRFNSDGGASVTARGVCWNTAGSPTVADSKTTDGTGTSGFVSTLTGLSASTTYYVRAYATNSVGTAYGPEISFTTSAADVAAVYTWAARAAAGSRNWGSIAGSSDGTKLAAVVDGGLVYTTADAGDTWTERTDATSGSAYGIASSGDGATIVVPRYGSSIWTSVDAGATWTERAGAGTRDWSSAAASSDGTKLAAANCSGYIYTSADGGATWAERAAAGSRTWYSIAMSSDGTRLAAADWGGYIHTSADGGVTWTARTGASVQSWNSIASSSDGTKLAGVVSGGGIWTSADSGATWTRRTAAGVKSWYCIASSADGATLAAAASGGFVYVSTDSGATWMRCDLAASSWLGITMSADGGRIAAAACGGSIYTASSATAPAVTTTAAAHITATTAEAGGNVTSDGGNAVTARGVCWNTAGNPTTADSKTADGAGTGVFTSDLASLAPGTTYHVRAYATNGVGTAYGEDLTFTTPAVAPTVTTATVGDVATTSATCGGEVTATGGAAVTARGVCWNTTGSPTIADSKTANGDGTGTFTSSLAGLSPDTTYHVRAYATNSVDTAYGTERTFTTVAVRTVTFAAGSNGSLAGTTSQTIAHGGDCTAVTATADAHHHFVNWTGTGGFATTTDNPLTVTNVTADMAITANFAVDTYTVTFAAGANGSITGTTSQTIDHGGSGSAVSAVPAAGYHFVNWTGTGGFVTTTSNPLTVSNVTGNMAVTANFAINNYTVEFAAGANGSLTGTTSQAVDHGGDCSAVTANAAAGYHFVNWTGTSGFSSTDNPLTLTNVSQAMTLTANFAINSYTVTFAAGASGSLSGTASQGVDHGGSCSAVSAVPAAGYHLVNWTGTGGFVTTTDNPLTVSNVTGDMTITANFAINSYTVDFVAGANGALAGTANQNADHGGDCVAVTAVPDANYHFINWTGTGDFVSTDNPLTVTGVSQNMTISANFAIDACTVTFAAGANGTISGTTTQSVNYGGSCSAVTATPAAGYHFVSWTGTGGFASTDNPLTLTNVTADITVTANFALRSYQVTFTAGEGGTLSGPVSQAVGHGGSCVEVTAVPMEGYRFTHWTGPAGYTCTDACLVYANVTADATLAAAFAQQPAVQVTVEPESDAVDPETGTVSTGAEVPFLVTIANTGGDASEVTIVIPLPANTEFVSGELVTLPAGAGIPADVTVEDGNILIRVPQLLAGANVGVRLVLRAVQSGSVVLAPKVQSAEQPDPAPAGDPVEVIANDDIYTIVTVVRPYGFCGAAGITPLLTLLGLGCAKFAGRRGSRWY